MVWLAKMISHWQIIQATLSLKIKLRLDCQFLKWNTDIYQGNSFFYPLVCWNSTLASIYWRFLYEYTIRLIKYCFLFRAMKSTHQVFFSIATKFSSCCVNIFIIYIFKSNSLYFSFNYDVPVLCSLSRYHVAHSIERHTQLWKPDTNLISILRLVNI